MFPFSVEHILGNLVMQLLLGIPLELVHKGFEVGMVYLAGVLAGDFYFCLSKNTFLQRAYNYIMPRCVCALLFQKRDV